MCSTPPAALRSTYLDQHCIADFHRVAGFEHPSRRCAVAPVEQVERRFRPDSPVTQHFGGMLQLVADCAHQSVLRRVGVNHNLQNTRATGDGHRAKEAATCT
jgi:hypothetical protein